MVKSIVYVLNPREAIGLFFRGLDGLPLTRQRCNGIFVPSFWRCNQNACSIFPWVDTNESSNGTLVACRLGLLVIV